MIGVMSIIPMLGITCLKGRRIGSLTAYDQRIQIEYGEIGSHELITRTRIAICTNSNSHNTISLNMPLGPLPTANTIWYSWAVTKLSRLTISIPPITTAASPQSGALAGVPPAATTRRSIGASIGSIFVLAKRATPPKGFIRRVRTAQSMMQKSASIATRTSKAILTRPTTVLRAAKPVVRPCASFTE